MENDDDLPSKGEQFGFSEAHDVVRSLVDVEGYDASEVGEGILIAAISCLKRSLDYEEIALLLYRYADFNAVRDKFPDEG